jgi:hypothetical protein
LHPLRYVTYLVSLILEDGKEHRFDSCIDCKSGSLHNEDQRNMTL